MSINEKPGGGGEMQPYFPKGNGDKSGEYTNKSNSEPASKKQEVNEKELLKASEDFCEKTKSSRKYLEKTMSKEEIDSVVKYSNYEYGVALNLANRMHNLTEEQSKDTYNIVNSIKRHYLPSIVLFRGARYTKERRDALVDAIETCAMQYGQLITSTTRDRSHAFANAYPEADRPCPVVFECEIPANYHGLPIEDIAFDRREHEVLLSEPAYVVQAVEEVIIGKIKYDLFHIKIIEV